MPSANKWKYCNCSRTCGKLISARQRRKHYKRGNPLNRLPSESPSESSDSDADSDSDSDSDFSHPDIAMDDSISDNQTPHPSILPFRQTVSPSCEEVDDDDDEDSDISMSEPESEFELDEEDEWIAFDEGQERTECAGRDEMLRDLEEMLGPDEEAELWDCSAYQKSSHN